MSYNLKQLSLACVSLACIISLAGGSQIAAAKTTQQVFLEQGVTAYQQKKFQQALTHFKAAKNLGLNNANFYYWVGAALLGLDKPKEALLEFRAAVRLDPKFKAAHRKIRELEQAISQNRDLKQEKEKLFFKIPSLLNLLALKAEISQLPAQQQIDYWHNLKQSHPQFAIIQKWQFKSVLEASVENPAQLNMLGLANLDAGELSQFVQSVQQFVQQQIAQQQYAKATQFLSLLKLQLPAVPSARFHFQLLVIEGQLQTKTQPNFDPFNYYHPWLGASAIVLDEWQTLSFEPQAVRFREALFRFLQQTENYFGLVQLLDYTPPAELASWKIQATAEATKAGNVAVAPSITTQLMQAWLFKQQRNFKSYVQTLNQLRQPKLLLTLQQQAFRLHAEQNWQSALALANQQPTTVEWQLLKAEIHFRLHQPTLAAEALAGTPADWFLYKKIADLAYFQQKYLLSFELLKNWYLHPRLEKTIQPHAWWHFKSSGNQVASEQVIKAIHTANPTTHAEGPNLELEDIYLYERAKLAMRSQDWVTAENLLNQLTTKNPFHATAWQAKSVLYGVLGQPEQVIKNLNRAVLLDEQYLLSRTWPKKYLNLKQQLPFLAHQSSLMQNPLLAEQFFSKLGLQNNHFGWWLRLNNSPKESAKFKKLLPNSPKIVQDLFNLPQDPEQRIKRLQSLIQQEKDFSLLYNILLETYYQAGLYAAMNEYFDEKKTMHLNLANLYKLTQIELALQEFKMACHRLQQIQPAYLLKNINFIHFLASCHAKMQRLQLAYWLYETAKIQHKKSSLPAYQIGLLAIENLNQGLLLHQINQLETSNLRLAQKLGQLWHQQQAMYPKLLLN